MLTLVKDKVIRWPSNQSVGIDGPWTGDRLVPLWRTEPKLLIKLLTLCNHTRKEEIFVLMRKADTGIGKSTWSQTFVFIFHDGMSIFTRFGAMSLKVCVYVLINRWTIFEISSFEWAKVGKSKSLSRLFCSRNFLKIIDTGQDDIMFTATNMLKRPK